MPEQPAILLLGFGDEMKTNVAVRTSTRSTSVSELNELVAKRERPELDEPAGESGGLIIETEHDMPALEALLQSHKVKTAVILADRADDTSTGQTHTLPRTWKERIEAEFRAAVAAAHGNAEVDERLWFLSALPEDDLDAVVSQALAVLAGSTLTERSWERFLEAQGRRVFSERPHNALAPLDGPQPIDEEYEHPPLFTLADLGMTFTEGAIGGPPPLADRS